MDALWRVICEKQNIPKAITESWLDKIHKKYSDSNRFYHNEVCMINKKLSFIENSSDFIVFATIFQYYEFDSKRNCTEQNCNVFRDFYKESGVDNVSTFINM